MDASIDLRTGYSIETLAKPDLDFGRLGALLAPGTEVFVTALPKDDDGMRIEVAKRIAAARLAPVLHIAARRIESAAALDGFLARLRGEAGADRALLIGGEDDRPRGPFASCLEVLETGLFARHGFVRVGLGGFPEGHPKVSAATGEAALLAKSKLATEQGLDPYVTTQFAFDAEAVVTWLRRLRQAGMTAPVRVGLAGPASIATLVKFALMCGVTRSLKRLTQDASPFAKLVGRAGPEPVIAELQDALRREPALGVAGLHFYAFGGVIPTAEWAAKLAAAEPARA